MANNAHVQITVVGTGYVGLVSGACFAAIGHQVICIDKDQEKISKLKNAKIPIYEPGLETLVKQNLAEQRLRFDTHLGPALQASTVLFVAVGTPTRPNDGRADLKYIEEVVTEIAPLLTDYKLVVIKSTVPVGTGHYVKKLIYKLNPKAKFDIVSNPEFLREGSAVSDFMYPDRIIVGTENEQARKLMYKIYQPFIANNIRILHTDLESSELIKYAANCFLATKIAFINEIATLCEKTGAHIDKVTEGLGLDKRIGSGYLQVGPGFGGSCFPKDTLALVQIARDLNAPLDVVEAVVKSNNQRKFLMVNKIIEACQGTVTGKKLAILGVAFKANTDDFRESAALTIIQGLLQEGAHIVAYDPGVLDKGQSVLPTVEWASGIDEALKGADALVIITEWPDFAKLDLLRVKSLLKKAHNNARPAFIDLRNLYNPKTVHDCGMHYVSIGRPHFEYSPTPTCAESLVV